MLAVWLIISSMLYSLRLSNGGSFPKPLTAREEREYLERAAQGDLEARNVLIERNLRLVAHIMKKYYTQTSDQEDLISIGTIGLIKGISTFDPKKGARALQHMRQGVLKMQCTRRGVISTFNSQNRTAAQARSVFKFQKAQKAWHPAAQPASPASAPAQAAVPQAERHAPAPRGAPEAPPVGPAEHANAKFPFHTIPLRGHPMPGRRGLFRQLRDELLERLAERLFKRRVRAHGCQQLAGRHAVGNGLTELADHIGRMLAHELRAEQHAGLRVGDDLHKAAAGACDHGAGVGKKACTCRP